MNEQMLQILQQMSEEERQQLFRDYGGEGRALESQLANAQRLRNTPTRQGIQSGGQYVAASPMSGLAQTINKGVGEYQRYQGLKEQKALSDAQAQAQKMLAEKILGGQMSNRQIDPLQQMAINEQRNPLLDT